ncbi:MAG: ABC transporter permease, partial [Bacteroidota bacterium]
MAKPQPPKYFQRFIEWYCKPRLQESILGDIEEQFYEEVVDRGPLVARRRYMWNVIRFFRPGIVKKPTTDQKLNNYGMFKNYYKVSLRSILRSGVFSVINISGLAIGIASCLLILIYVKNEASYDTFNEKYERTYRVLHYYGQVGEEVAKDTLPQSELQVWGNAPVADVLTEYFPQIEHVFRFTSNFDWLVEYNGQRFQEKNIVYGDSTLHHVFSWKWIYGNPETALQRPSTIVLSHKMARKYFGDDDPVGKSLLLDSDEQYEVTGVYEIPPNSHFSFDACISMTSFIKRRPEIFGYWGYVDFYTYFTIHEGADIASLEAQIPIALQKYFNQGFAYTFQFEPLASAYLASDAKRQPGPTGNADNIYLFICIAGFLLAIAIINFTNLSTARSIARAKEVAVRKTVGSSRQALVLQFLLEATILTLIATAIAVFFTFLGHSYLERLVGKTLPIAWLLTPKVLLLAVLGILGIGLLAGAYPAFALSSFRPITVLRGTFKHSTRGSWLRKSLVVLQFALSLILLVGTVVVTNQLSFLRQYDKGFEDEQVLVLEYGYDSRVQRSLALLKAEFLKHPAVQSISASRATPGDFFPNAHTEIEGPTGEMTAKGPALYEIDEDFIPTYQMEIVAGRNYSRDFPLDSINSLIVNESAAKLFGYPDPSEIVGQRFAQWGREGKVIGVVKDFNYVSLHDDVEPMTLRYS